MASEKDHPRISDENSQKNKKQKRSEKRRGPTTAKYIIKDDDGPYPLKWNDYGVAVGEFKDRYTAYTGALTRAKVKICTDKWSEVDDDVKEKLWEATKNIFKCDDDKKTYVLRDCKTRWKDFKTRLTHDYFTTATKNEEENPPWDVYVGIDKDDWLKFKETRLDSKFKALSDRNRSNQQKNEHPHRLGRGGYSKREEQHVKEQMKKSILSGASSSGLESDTSTARMVTPRPRYERWIDGRTKKKGEIPNPKSKLVANKIYELMEAQNSGEFVSEGSHDILTEALGVPERGGYVRGLGGKAKLSVVFKRKKRSCQNEGMMTLRQVEEFALQLTEQVREQTRSEMKEVTLEILRSCGVQIPQDLELNMINNKDIDDGGTPRTPRLLTVVVAILLILTLFQMVLRNQNLVKLVYLMKMSAIELLLKELYYGVNQVKLFIMFPYETTMSKFVSSKYLKERKVCLCLFLFLDMKFLEMM